MSINNLRNVAIIAHVDHGKTTLVDKLLQQSGTLDRKKWKSFEMHVESSELRQSNFDISAELENLDRTISVGSLSGFNNSSNLAEGEDISIRGRLGNPRAYGVQFTINNTTGRPRLRALKTDGIESFRTVEKAI